MQKVEVKKDELLGVLENNLSQHRDIFEQAIEGYRNRAVELLEEHIDRIKSGKVEQVKVYLPAPEDHSDEYERAIAMVKADIQDTVELTQTEFAQLWMDDWSWKREFLMSAATYTND